MKKYDVAVIGGGFSGVAAAIAAAREGARVIILLRIFHRIPSLSISLIQKSSTRVSQPARYVSSRTSIGYIPMPT